MHGGASTRGIGRILKAAPVAVAALLAVPGAALAAGQGATVYSLSAKGASLTPGKGMGLRLELGKPADSVEALVGRRSKGVPVKPPQDFVRSWGRYGLRRNPPVAAIRDLGAPASRDVILVRLSRPELLKGGGISFLATPADGAGPKALRRWSRAADAGLARALGRAEVLVAGTTRTGYARIDWNFAGQWGSTFNTPFGPVRLIDWNPFSGSGFFGQDPRQGFTQFGFGSAGGGYGYFVLQTSMQGDCFELANLSDQPFTSLELTISRSQNLANSTEGPIASNGVTELCL